jgi:hypothetical protein
LSGKASLSGYIKGESARVEKKKNRIFFFFFFFFFFLCLKALEKCCLQAIQVLTRAIRAHVKRPNRTKTEHFSAKKKKKKQDHEHQRNHAGARTHLPNFVFLVDTRIILRRTGVRSTVAVRRRSGG